ncbi:ATP-binding protein [Mycobacterium sp. DL440]|uniref:ATP-binding protein n=1 Tax=Mycobacterium sp. DL440 TaxID=2675523 RepID=UPI0014237FCF|nr:ATP-binding protein [Mycobacterium sp. DL440]
MAAPTTKEQWREFCAYTNTPDALQPNLTCAEIADLTPTERKAYNARRYNYIDEERVMKTRNLLVLEASAERLLHASEKPRHTLRSGLQISGPPWVGKTTAITYAARKLEAEMRRRYDRIGDLQYLPLLYISLTAATTPAKLWAIIAHFLGLPEGSFRDDSAMFRLCALLRVLGTRFVFVDEVQRLNTDHIPDIKVADSLKSFAEYLDATMIYAGTDLDTAPLFTGKAGAQWRARCKRTNMQRYEHKTNAQQREWAELAGGFEQYLPLPRHHSGYLIDHADYLWDRCQGSIGTLRELIADGAYLAITSGEERITTELLDVVAVDEEARRLAAEATQPPPP